MIFYIFRFFLDKQNVYMFFILSTNVNSNLNTLLFIHLTWLAGQVQSLRPVNQKVAIQIPLESTCSTLE